MSETHEGRLQEAKAYQDRQKARAEKKAKEVEEHYELRNNKVVKVKVAPSGARYTEYVGRAKHCQEIIREHKLR